MKLRLGNSIGTKFILYQVISFSIILILIGGFQYQTVRDRLYERVETSGRNLLGEIEAILSRHPDLFSIEQFQPVVLEFSGKIPDIQRISLVDYRMRVIADSEPGQVGRISDQSALVRVMQEDQSDFYYYTQQGLRYYRLSRPIRGRYDPQRQTNIIGAVTIDMKVSPTDAQVTRSFIQIMLVIAALMLILGGALYLLVRRIIVAPLLALTNVTQKIQQGQLDTALPAFRPDEIGLLIAGFDNMLSQLRQTLANLSNSNRTLAVSAEVSRRLSTILERDQLLTEVVEQIRRAFDYYHVQAYLLDEATDDLILAAATGQKGQKMLALNHRLPKGKGLVGRAVQTNTIVSASDTTQAVDWLPNPLLPETRTEVAVPIAYGERILGILDVQHSLVDSLKLQEIDLILSIADQVAVALNNIRLFQQAQASLAEVEELNRRLTRDVWHDVGRKLETTGYLFAEATVAPTPNEWLPVMGQAIKEKDLVQGGLDNDNTDNNDNTGDNGYDEQEGANCVAIPLLLRGEVIGVIGVERAADEAWLEDELATIRTVTDQVALALESARLARQTQRNAWRDQLVSETTAQVWSSSEVEEVMRATVAQLGEKLGAAEVVIQLNTDLD